MRYSLTKCIGDCVLAVVMVSVTAQAQPPGLRLFPQHADGKWGYVGPDGQFVVRPQFDAAGPFSEGLAAILVTEKWGYINPVGEYPVPPQFELAGPFSEGLAFVRVFGDRTFGFIDHRGEMVIRPQFAWAGSFRGGLAPVKQGDTYGFVNTRGEVQIEPRFTRVLPFAEGLAAVQIDEKYGYIDQRGAMVLEPQFVEAQRFSEGFAWVRRFREPWSCIRRDGTAPFDGRFERAFPFSGGFAVVRVEGKFGVIDTRGDFIQRPSAETVLVADDDHVVALGTRNRMVATTVRFEAGTNNKGTYLSEVRQVPWMKPVHLLSDPGGARVYRVTWLTRKYASSVEELLTDRNAVPEGDTTKVTAWLDERKEWTIIFERDGTVREKNCVPGINEKVEVDFD